jgi:hypothetical protein
MNNVSMAHRVDRQSWSTRSSVNSGITRTADYLLCRQCGVYVGAVCETPAGPRAVINTRCLDDRAASVREAVHPNYDGETVAARLARRALNWTPAVMHDLSAT